MSLEKRNNRGSSLQYTGWMSEGISLVPPVAGGLFFLDIPLYRTRLPSMGTGTNIVMESCADSAFVAHSTPWQLQAKRFFRTHFSAPRQLLGGPWQSPPSRLGTASPVETRRGLLVLLFGLSLAHL